MQRESLPVIFYSGKCIALINKADADARRRNGSAKFDKHEYIHENTQGFFPLADTGRCVWCDSESCERVRVSVLRLLEAPNPFPVPRYNAARNWKRMRVRGNKKGRKPDVDQALIRAIEPSRSQIEYEVAALNQRNPLAVLSQDDNVDALIRIFELEVETARLDGGPEAARSKREEQRRSYIEWLSSHLENQESARAYWYKHIVKIRNLFFGPNERVLVPFEPFLKEMEALVADREDMDRRTAVRRSSRLKRSTH
jgi:hypothetical protein